MLGYMRGILHLDKLKYFIIIIFSFLIVFSYHPSIMKIDDYTGAIINPFSKYIIIAFCILFMTNILRIKTILRCPLIKTYMLIMLMILVYAVITIIFVGNKSIWWEVRSLTICLMAIIVGYMINISDKQLSRILVMFAISGLIVGLSIVITNVGGFIIEEKSNVTYKNAIGVVLSTASIIFFYLSYNKDYNKLYRIMLIAMSILLLASILTIRARAAGLLTIVVLGVVLYLRNKNTETLLITTIVIVILIFAMPQSIENFIVDSFFKGFEGKDVTSDRGRRNQEALLFLKDNLFIGNMNMLVDVDQIHNYPLRILFNGGIIFSFPILLLYCYLLVKGIYYVFKVNVIELRNIGFVTILIPFGISMLEPTLPFGPGTTTVFNFILLGIALRNLYEQKNI